MLNYRKSLARTFILYWQLVGKSFKGIVVVNGKKFMNK